VLAEILWSLLGLVPAILAFTGVLYAAAASSTTSHPIRMRLLSELEPSPRQFGWASAVLRARVNPIRSRNLSCCSLDLETVF
jgi:hypothetical protein